jgi:hypothetical protein
MAHSDAPPQDARASLSAQSGNGAIITPMRRFPPPWTLDEANNAWSIVRDNTGQSLGYVTFYFGNDESEARTGVHRFRALDGWQVADGVTGFGRTTTLDLSGVMSATSNWSLRLGLRETATLRWDVTRLPSGCVDLNVSS